MTLAITLGSFLLGCTAGVFGMICVAPLMDADERPVDETQDDPRLVDAMREVGL